MIDSTLKNLGLSSNQILVYKSLLGKGSITASLIAKSSGLPRQTVYSILNDLIADKFVEKGDIAGVLHFYADPDQLIFICDKKRKQIEESKMALQAELPKFLGNNTQNGHLKLKYYEGVDGQKRLFENILEYYKRGGKKEFRGYGTNYLKKALGDYLVEFVKNRSRYGVSTKLFIGEGENDFAITNESNKYGREVKQLKMPSQDAGFYIVGNKIYLFSYKDQVGVVVENETIANLLVEVFNDHWDHTK